MLRALVARAAAGDDHRARRQHRRRARARATGASSRSTPRCACATVPRSVMIRRGCSVSSTCSSDERRRRRRRRRGPGRAGGGARRWSRPGATVVVLEARDRVGGRTLNEDIGDGKVVEVGGQWVGPTQFRLLELAARARRRDVPDAHRGHVVIEWRGAIQRYDGLIPRINPAILLDYEQAQLPARPPRPHRPARGAVEGAERPRARRARRSRRGCKRNARTAGGRALLRDDLRGGVGARAGRRLAAARPLLHPLGRRAGRT